MNKFLKVFAALALLMIVIAFQGSSKKESAWEDTEIFSASGQSVFQQKYSGEESPQRDSSTNFIPPLDDASKRVTKKPFGIFITSENSPVQPENFYGYHTGVDFEILESEENKNVEIYYICDGKVLEKRFANGYGGVLVQLCRDKESFVTVVYGHINIKSISKNIGEEANKGEKLGVLGEGFSSETDGERKHLHLGMHKGSETNIAGYVSNKANLSSWIDPCEFVCGK